MKSGTMKLYELPKRMNALLAFSVKEDQEEEEEEEEEEV